MNVLEERTYTPTEAAPKLRLQVETVRLWIRTKRIKAAKRGRQLLIPESEIVRIMTPQ